VFIYLDTPGGSVESGNRLLMEIQKYNLSCIADRAYSMGFVLLQGCKTRYIRPYGRIMQHQISYGVKGEKGKIDSYQQFIHQLEDDLVTIQANRVKLTPQEFRYKTMNEWWMIGRHAVENDCVDNIADVFCDDALTRQNYTINYGPIELIYSQCPLVNDPIDTKIRYD
jgi:ATP-dependent protease ClpP protease subunit